MCPYLVSVCYTPLKGKSECMCVKGVYACYTPLRKKNVHKGVCVGVSLLKGKSVNVSICVSCGHNTVVHSR